MEKEAFATWFESDGLSFAYCAAVATLLNPETFKFLTWGAAEEAKLQVGLWNAYKGLCGKFAGEDATATRTEWAFKAEVNLFIRHAKVSAGSFATFWNAHKNTLECVWELCRAIFCLRCSNEEAERQLRKMQDSRRNRQRLSPARLLLEQMARTGLKMSCPRTRVTRR